MRCCTYITVEIDAPRAAWEYDQWIWALHHEGIELYLERPEKWFLHVETRCRQLNQAGRCSIHGRHPVLCREYDARTCERRQPLSDLRCWFRDAEAFELWLKSERPAHWARLATYRERQPHGIPVADARAKGAASGFIALADLAAPASSRRGRSA